MKTAHFSAVVLWVAALGHAPANFAQSNKAAADMVGAPGSKPRASNNARINRLDTNGDGMISRDEARGYPDLAKAFNRLDINQDKLLTSDELLAFRRGKATASRPASRHN